MADRANAVCVGHLLYGLSPFADASVADLSAYPSPVLTEVGSRLVQVSDHPQGSDIAIAGSYGIRRGRRTGVAPVGAAQGLARPAPGSRPEALIRGRRAPVLAVSLEHLTLDLTDIEDAAAGDAVLLLGGDGEAAIGLDEFAAWSGRRELDTVLAIAGRLTAHYRGADGGRRLLVFERLGEVRRRNRRHIGQDRVQVGESSISSGAMGGGRALSKGGVTPGICVKAGCGFSVKNARKRRSQSPSVRSTAKEGVEPMPAMRFFGPTTWQRPQLNQRQRYARRPSHRR